MFSNIVFNVLALNRYEDNTSIPFKCNTSDVLSFFFHLELFFSITGSHYSRVQSLLRAKSISNKPELRQGTFTSRVVGVHLSVFQLKQMEREGKRGHQYASEKKVCLYCIRNCFLSWESITKWVLVMKSYPTIATFPWYMYCYCGKFSVLPTVRIKNALSQFWGFVCIHYRSVPLRKWQFQRVKFHLLPRCSQVYFVALLSQELCGSFQLSPFFWYLIFFISFFIYFSQFEAWAKRQHNSFDNSKSNYSHSSRLFLSSGFTYILFLAGSAYVCQLFSSSE